MGCALGNSLDLMLVFPCTPLLSSRYRLNTLGPGLAWSWPGLVLAWFTASSLTASHGLESRGKLRGRVTEGQTQGAPEAGGFFAGSIQKPLEVLDAAVAAVGGMARAGWDDIYVIGPPEVVFPALDVFWQYAEEHCGLERQRTKCAVYSHSGQRPPSMPADMPLAGDEIDGEFLPGFLCFGIPVGADRWVTHKLEEKVREVAGRALSATKLLGGTERQGLWTVLRGSLKFQFEYWLGLVYPSLVREAARSVDRILLEVLEQVVGQHIPLSEEGLGWEEALTIPVRALDGRSFQSWLVRMPIRHGGMGLACQEDLAPLAFIGSLEQALPFFGGESGIWPPLAHLVGGTPETRYSPLVESGCRTGRELLAAWREVQEEYREACLFLGKEEEGPASVEVGAIGDGSTTGATRKLLARAREEWRFDCFEQSLGLQGRAAAKGRAISSWKERDKLCTAFLLQSPGPHS